MTIRNLDRRLKRLEAQMPRTPDEQRQAVRKSSRYMKILTMCAIAQYFGNPQPHDSMMTGYARALGYQSTFEYQKAAQENYPEHQVRVIEASIRVFAKFGLDLAEMGEEDGLKFAQAMNGMESGLCEHYKETLRRIDASPLPPHGLG
jgi:hypothetical protein